MGTSPKGADTGRASVIGFWPWPCAGVRNPKIAIGAIVVLLLLSAPLALDNFWLRFATSVVMLAVLGHSGNVMLGFSGYPALGNIVYFGVGAYAGGVLSVLTLMPPIVTIPFGAAAASLLALVASPAMFALRGSHFLMGTVALNALMLEVALVLRDVTGGPLGLSVPAWVTGTPSEVYAVFYYAFVILFALSAVTLFLLRRSKLGFGLLAIRGNEDAAESFGVPTFAYKTSAWALSAAIAGAAGVVYAHWIGHIEAGVVFDLVLSIEIFVMMLIGGRWLILGPLVGALLFEFVEVQAWSRLGNINLGFVGLLIVGLVLFLPGGLPDLATRLRSALRTAQQRLRLTKAA